MRDLTTLTRGALLLSAIALGACTDDDSDTGSDTGSSTGTSSSDAGARSSTTSGSGGTTTAGSTQSGTAGRTTGGGGSGGSGGVTARGGTRAEGGGGATSTANSENGGTGGANSTSTAAGGTGGTGGSGGATTTSTSTTTGGAGGTSSTAGAGGAANRAGAGGSSNAGGSGGSSNAAGVGGGSSTAGAGGAANAAGAGGGGVMMVTLNDAQIASISLAANTGEVDQNTVGVARATSPEVRSFARDMVAMHTAAAARETALATAAMIVPADNQITQTLQTMSRDVVTMLTAVDADEFDVMFMNGQVEVHAQVLALINDQLLPQVTSEALRTELMAMQATVTTHLGQARTLAASVGGSSNMP